MERIYLAGPMTNIPYFNFPAFHAAAKKLREEGHIVFSPAVADIFRHKKDISLGNETGDPKQAVEEHNFSIRDALYEDTKFICLQATAIALLPGWEKSSGAFAEWALARALGLKMIYL